FPGVVVPHDVGGVVIAVRAQRLPELSVVTAVSAGAHEWGAVRAAGEVAAGAAGPGAAAALVASGAGVAGDDAGVHGAERGRGEGGEHGRVERHGGLDGLAADEAGADDLVGVALVGLRARGAGVGAAVAARLVDHAVGHVLGRAGVGFAGAGVDGGDVAVQEHGVGAAGGGPDV